MKKKARFDSVAAPGDHLSIVWVPWDMLRPTQGAIGYVQVQAKMASYFEVEPQRRRRFVEERPIVVVRGPAQSLHIVDHHHWARVWFDMGLQEAPVRIREDFSVLTREEFIETMWTRGWFHIFDERGRERSLWELPGSIELVPDDVFQSLAAFVRAAGVFKNPGEFNAKFAWADFLRRRIPVRPSTVAGFAQMLGESIVASRSPEAKNLPGFIWARTSSNDRAIYAGMYLRGRPPRKYTG